MDPDFIDLGNISKAKGGGQGYWQCKCSNRECLILTYETWTNDRTSPTESYCPSCYELGEKISDSENTTKVIDENS